MNKLPPYVHFDEKKKGTGAYYYVIRIGTHLKCCRGFNTPENAYAAAMMIMRDPSRLVKQVTLKQAVDFWLASLAETHVRESIQNYRGYFYNWIFPYLDPGKNYAKISDAELTFWRSAIERNNKLNVVSKNRLKNALVMLHDFSNSFLEIENRAMLRVSSFISSDLTPFFEDFKKPVLSPAEFKKMLAVSDDDYTRLLLTLSLCCGLRIGEARGLTVDCFRDNKLCIAKQVKGDGGGHSLISRTKTASSRRLCYLPERVSAMLRTHIKLNHLNISDFIFYGSIRSSEPASENLINNRFKSAALAAGIEGVYFHIFRHSVATLLGRAGIRQRAIDLLLGHAAKTVTDKHYNLVVEADWIDIIDVLNREIFDENVIKNVISN